MRRVLLGLGVLGALALLFLLLGSDAGPEAAGPAFEEETQGASAVGLTAKGRAPAATGERRAVVRHDGPCPTEYREVLDRLPPWVWHGPRGPTDWIQRLRAGALLLRLREEAREETIDLCTLRCSLSFLDTRLLFIERRQLRRSREPDPVARLDIDALFDLGDQVPRADWLRLLDGLLERRIDREQFSLHVTRKPDEPFGLGRLVRVWTPAGRSFPVQIIRASEALLRRVDRAAGFKSKAGYDVHCAPDLARARFPALASYRGVMGLYFRWDEFAIVDAQYTGAAMQRLLNHELVHAWSDAALKQRATRFVSEGLAEYLAWLRQGDPGLDVPDARLRDNFAALLRLLERLQEYGVPLEHFPLRKLMRASPWGFYALGWIGYAIAQACYAYLPVSVLEEALAERSGPAFLEAFERITWRELLAWIREAAREGNPDAAVFHVDPIGTVYDAAGSGARLMRRRALRELFGRRASIDAYEDALFSRETDPLLASDERRTAVLKRLRAARGEALDVVVETRALAEVQLDAVAAKPAPWLPELGSVETIEALPFVDRMHAWFRADPPGRTLTLAAAEEGTGPVVRLISGDSPLRVTGLMPYLTASAAAKGTDLVLVVRSEDEVFRSLLTKSAGLSADLTDADRDKQVARGAVRHMRENLLDRGWSARTVLVIDIGDGSGEARAFADAMQRAAPKGGLVSYWRVGRAAK